METKELMKQFMEAVRKRNQPLKKEIKLRPINRKKYCMECREIVEVEVKGMHSFCPNCDQLLYILDNHREFVSELPLTKIRGFR